MSSRAKILRTVLVLALGSVFVALLLVAGLAYLEVRSRRLGSADFIGPAFDVRVESWSDWNGLAARTGRHEILVRDEGDAQWRHVAFVPTRAECSPQSTAAAFGGSSACLVAIDHVVACTSDRGGSWAVTDFGTLCQGPSREPAVVLRISMGADGAATVSIALERSPDQTAATSTTSDFGRSWSEPVLVR